MVEARGVTPEELRDIRRSQAAWDALPPELHRAIEDSPLGAFEGTDILDTYRRLGRDVRATVEFLTSVLGM